MKLILKLKKKGCVNFKIIENVKITKNDLNRVKIFLGGVIHEIRDEAIPLLIEEFNSEFRRK